MLSNAYFVAKFRFDTAENEPAKNLQKFCKNPRAGSSSDLVVVAVHVLVLEERGVVDGVREGHRALRHLPSATRRPIGKISERCCSFSAVSAPIFARKYAFFSIFQNLPDYPAENFEMTLLQYFANFATFANFLLNFHENC